MTLCGIAGTLLISRRCILMNWIIEILGAIFSVFFIVLIHELGHFSLAKLLGVKVLRFSIGFGKTLLSFRSKSGTEYVLAILPLGGYVKMLSHEDLEQYPDEKNLSFENQAYWKRMLILLAGPFSNFLLAFILYWLIFVMGMQYVRPVIGNIMPNTPAYASGLQHGDEITQINHSAVFGWADVSMQLIGFIGSKKTIPITVKRNHHEEPHSLSLTNFSIDDRKFDLFEAVGIVPYQPPGPPIIAEVAPDSPAAQAGLKPHDLIQTINNQPIANWSSAQKIIQAYPDQKVNIALIREKKPIYVTAILSSHQLQQKKVGYLGIAFKIPKLPEYMMGYRDRNPLTAWYPASREVYKQINLNYKVLIKILAGEISPSGLSGPVGIFQTAGAASEAGIKVYILFIALISVALGFINLLPIPILDGGHILILTIERIFRKEIPTEAKKIIMVMGIVFLFMIMMYATYNDLLQYFITS